MRFWLVPSLLLAAGAAVWWVRRRTAVGYLDWLVRRSQGDHRRGSRAVLLSQSAGLAVAILLLVVAVLSEQWQSWFWVRIPLCGVVIAGYVPLATALAPARFRWQRSAAARLLERGATVPVAAAVAARGRIFAAVGSAVFLLAVLLLSWHHLH